MEGRLEPIVLSLALTLGACGGGASPGAPTPASPPPDATIGPAGGTVAGAGGAARLVVPAGALTTSVGLSIRASNQGPLDPHAVFRIAHEITPAATLFAVPATLVVRFDPSRGPSGTDEADWRVGVLDGGGAWQPIAGWDYHQGNLPLASNEITKEGRGCLIEEHFQDPTGVQGRSVSLLSRQDGQWHQTHIDSQGTFLALVGGLQGRRMVLNQSATHRFSWDPLDADTVRYFGEQSADGGNMWVVNLDAQYTRR